MASIFPDGAHLRFAANCAGPDDTNSIWMIRDAALHGGCIGILPIFSIVEELKSGQLVPVLEDYRVDSAMLYAFYRRSPLIPAKVRMLLNYLIEHYSGEPPWEQRLFRDRPNFRRIVYGDELTH